MTWYIKLHLDWRGLISMNNQRYDFSEVFSFLLKAKISGFERGNLSRKA